MSRMYVFQIFYFRYAFRFDDLDLDLHQNAKNRNGKIKLCKYFNFWLSFSGQHTWINLTSHLTDELEMLLDLTMFVGDS